MTSRRRDTGTSVVNEWMYTYLHAFSTTKLDTCVPTRQTPVKEEHATLACAAHTHTPDESLYNVTD